MRLDEISPADREINILYNLILDECKPWLRESQNGKLVLYRGLRYNPFKPGESYIITPVPKDRKPIDTPQFIQDFYNDSIQKAGKVANRSNSIFVLGSISSLQTDQSIFGEFSEYVVVVPMSKFNYTWSTAFRDGYKFYEDVLSFYSDRGLRTLDLPTKLENKIKDSWRGDDGSLQKAIRSRREILLSANNVLYIELKTYKKVMKLINE